MAKEEQIRELLSLLKDMKHKIAVVVMRQVGLDDVSFKQCQILEFLIEKSPCHMKTVAEAFCLSTAAVTKIIDRLEEGGYVKRVPCTDDRRKVMVEATAKGVDDANQFRKNMVAVLEKSLKDFNEGEVQTVCKFYRSISKNLDERIAEGS